MILLLFAALFAFVALGMNIWLAMGISGVAYILLMGDISLRMVSSTMIGGVDSTTLVAIPFFILAGDLMNRSGITAKITELTDYFIGRARGGLAYVAVVVNVIVAGVSGSAVADASAVSSVIVPTMVKRGYDKPFAASINAAAAVIGPIIPPSIPMIFIGVISGISIGKLFLGGVLPGLMMGAVLMVAIYFISKKRQYPVTEKKLEMKAVKQLARDSSFALLAPLIILGGVVFGIVTLVEVSVLAVLYILMISLFIYRSIRARELPGIFMQSAVFSSSIMIIFAVVGLYQYIIAYEQLGVRLGELIPTLGLSKFWFLLLVNIFLLVMGCILDGIPVMLIFFPVLLPAAVELGIDPTHFGVIVVLNLMIGLLTPPIGVLLFLESKIADVSFGALVREIWPFFLSLLFVLAVCTYVPGVVMWLPNLVFG
ncbi:TRAP transporter large permease [Martelella radicis]|uniref:TRAP transporter large permease protein n=1 Tax=Martelella radicis TaxID=1397476 RepID=A0A7W6PBL5_9HYPH|nr:TRAP transporter large permease [Martelella radicis]MBB4124612.1 tripartite ATP-independent transporter DctM subunit [Martelella radicis]